MTTGNKRFDIMIVELINSGKEGRAVLDCYMGRCIREEICHTITTRTTIDNNTWVAEIYETDRTDKRDE